MSTSRTTQFCLIFFKVKKVKISERQVFKAPWSLSNYYRNIITVILFLSLCSLVSVPVYIVQKSKWMANYKRCNFWHFKNKSRSCPSSYLLHTIDKWDYLWSPFFEKKKIISCFDIGEVPKSPGKWKWNPLIFFHSFPFSNNVQCYAVTTIAVCTYR